MVQKKSKILLLRFSSFGDVVQALSVASRLKDMSQEAEVHWVVRSDLAPLLEGHPAIKKIWPFSRDEGLWGLIRLGLRLQAEQFSHIYDAHNSLRSRVLSVLLRPPFHLRTWFMPPLFLRKSQNRWKRFLLFQFRINRFRMPFSGQRDLLEPLKKWGLSEALPSPPQIFVAESVREKIAGKLSQENISSFIALAPSAAHVLKRWPLAHWQKLIELLPQENFVLLGGKEDTFLDDLRARFPKQVLNWSGHLSYQDSIALIAQSKALITNDTGSLHIAEQLGHRTIALMGPAPFGFPSRPSTKILERSLRCRPCSKHGQGPCVNSSYQECLVSISPEEVQRELQKMVSHV